MTAYLSIFGADLKILDISLLTNALLACFAFLGLAQGKAVDWRFFFILISQLALTFLCLFSLSITNVQYQNFPSALIKFPFYLMSALGIIFLYKRRFSDQWSIKLLRHIRLSGLVTCFIIFIFLLSPELRTSIYNVLDLYLLEKYRYNLNHRISDLSIGGSTVSFALALILLEWRRFFYIQNSKRFADELFAVFVTGIFLGAIMLVARSGFIIAVSLLVFEFVFSNQKRAKRDLLILAVVGIFAIIAALSISSVIVSWALEFILKGISQVDSVSSYLRSFSLPFPPMSLLLGFAHTSSSNDSFILSLVHIVGVPLTLILFLGPFFSFSKFFMTPVKRIVYEPRVFLFLIFFLANMKESFWGDARGAIVLFLTLFLLDIFAENERRSSKNSLLSN